MSKKQQKNQVYSGKVRVRMHIPGAKKGQKVRLSKDQQRHLKVLRIKEGDCIRVFDGAGSEFEAIYSGKVSAPIVLEKRVLAQKEPKIVIDLAFAVPKGARVDFLVEKAVEIGVSRMVPVKFDRSSVLPRESKLNRLRKVIVEACCQSGRAVLPVLDEIVSFKDLLGTIDSYDFVGLCHKSGKKMDLGDARRVLLIVGPEGDFSAEELSEAKKVGCSKVSLGPTILRIETACLSAVSQAIHDSL